MLHFGALLTTLTTKGRGKESRNKNQNYPHTTYNKMNYSPLHYMYTRYWPDAIIFLTTHRNMLLPPKLLAFVVLACVGFYERVVGDGNDSLCMYFQNSSRS
jgi:hypothetical protein